MNENTGLRHLFDGTLQAISLVMMKDISNTKFLAEVTKLGGTTCGAITWLNEAIRCGLDESDDEKTLAWDCVYDELSNLETEDKERERVLLASLAAARRDGGASVVP